MKLSKALKTKLLELHNPEGPERVGFLLGKSKIQEVPNTSMEPESSFMVSSEDLLKYALSEDTIATWHTHPKSNSNLSTFDYRAFLNYPNLKHIIIGTDGIRVYEVEDGAVLQSDG
jgi:proteasome lid subunit RPN8/RPN11